MATDLQPAQSAPAARPSTSAKYDAFVEQQLRRARQRIRTLDLGAAALGFLVLTLGYGLFMALCDRWLELSTPARQSLFALYLLGSLAYLALALLLPLSRRINPYYAARKLEETLPEAKNSVVNWLDLHDETLSPAFHNAIGHRAAKDLSKADVDQAIRTRRTAWLGSFAGGLFAALVILFLTGPKPFLSLMQRAFAPFREITIASHTRLTLLRPEEGDLIIPVGRSVGFAVLVDGRVPDRNKPDAVRLLYRSNPNEVYEERLFDKGTDNAWTTTILASELPSGGFWYRVAGGDYQSEEYRVQVHSTPLLESFDVTYHFRPYLQWPDRTTHDRDLEELRGTEVALMVHTNRRVQTGQLLIAGEDPVKAELIAGDPQAMRFRWPRPLDKDGSYQVSFTSIEGERNSDQRPYAIRVRNDQAPHVELMKPGQDIHLPQDGLLELEGFASDDYGLTRLTLNLRVKEGPTLQPKPYRPGKILQQADGRFPLVLKYKDYVELDQLKGEDGKPLAVSVGSQIEYWLEAADNCDFPEANIGQSKHYTVTVDQPAGSKEKQQQQRNQAKQDQKKFEKKQDEQLNQKEEGQGDPQQGEGAQKENKQGEDAKKEEQKGKGTKEKKSDDQELKDRMKALQDAVKDKKDSKPDGTPNPDNKDTSAENQKPDKQPSQGNNQQGAKPQPDKKDGASPPKPAPGEKDGTDQSTGQPNPGQPPQPGKNNEQPGGNPDNKDKTKPQNQEQPGKGNPPQPPDKKQQPGDGSTQPDKKPSGNQQPGEAKPDQDSKKDNKAQGQSKGAGEKPPQQEPGASKDNPKSDSQSSQTPQKGTDQAGNPKSNEPKKTKGGEQSKGKPEDKKNESTDQAGNPKPSEPKKTQGGEQPKGKPEDKKNESSGSQQEKPSQGQPNPQTQNGPNGECKGGGQSGSQSGEAKGGSPQGGENNSTGGANSQGNSPKPNTGNPNPSANSGNSGGPKSQEAGTPGKPANSGATEPGKGSQPKQDAAASKADKERAKNQSDIEDLVKALQGKNQKAQEDATRKLDELRRNAKNDAERKALEDALKQAEERIKKDGDPGDPKEAVGKPQTQGQGTGKPKPGTQPEPHGDKQGEPKPGEGVGQKQGKGKPSQPGGEPKNQGDGDGNLDGRPKEDAKPGQSGSPTKRPGSGGGQTSGGNGELSQNNNSANTSTNDMAPPKDPNAGPSLDADKGDRDSAGNLQLENLKKKVRDEKDLLKRLNMTQAEFDKFVKAYEAMLKRQKPEPGGKEDLVAPVTGRRTGSGSGVRQVKPGSTDKEATQGASQGRAPLPYRPAQSEFSRKVSELEHKRSDK